MITGILYDELLHEILVLLKPAVNSIKFPETVYMRGMLINVSPATLYWKVSHMDHDVWHQHHLQLTIFERCIFLIIVRRVYTVVICNFQCIV